MNNMPASMFIDNAKVMSKGQVTIPKDVRDVLGVTSGDRVSFIVEGNNVRIVNANTYAMTMNIFHDDTPVQAERQGSSLIPEDDVKALVNEVRHNEPEASDTGGINPALIVPDLN